METTFVRVLVVTSVCSVSTKHVFISEGRNWWNAQEYCRTHFTDLSAITSEHEDQELKSVGEGKPGWIGLYNSGNRDWKWSGGFHASYQNWIHEQSYTHYKYFAVWTSNGWYYNYGGNNKDFYCLNLIVPEVRKSWDEAVNHCWEHHDNLTSMHSETERRLAQKVIQKTNITEQVWIGLRYLGDGWAWVNGEPLEYKAWSQGDQDHQCPLWKRCGAFTKGGLWESRDCNEKLNFICI